MANALESIRNIALGVSDKPPNTTLEYAIYLQEIRDAILGVSNKYSGGINTNILLQQIRNALRGVPDGPFSNINSVFYMQQIRNAILGVPDGVFTTLDEGYYWDEILAAAQANGLSFGMTGLFPFSQDFSVNPSLAGWQLQSGNAAVPGTALIITPTKSANMVDAAVSTCDNIGNWVKGGNNTLVSSGGELVFTFVDNGTGGTATLRDIRDLTSDLVLGALYELQAKVKVNAGSVSLRLLDGVSATTDRTVTATSLINHIYTFVARSATAALFVLFNMGAGEVANMDDWLMYRLTNAMITRKAQPLCTVGAALTIAERGTQMGVVINANVSADQNPTSYLAVMLMRGNSDSGSIVSVAQYSNGIFSFPLGYTVVTYVAGAILQIQQLTATTYRVTYNNVQVGSDLTISDANINSNIYAGLLGLYGGNSVNRFFCLSGSPVRIAFLGDSITAPASGTNLWSDLVCRDYNNGNTLKINHAVGGQCIMTIGGHTADMDIQTVNAASDAANKILIALGTNDNDDAGITAEYQENLLELQASNPAATIYGIGIFEKLSASEAWRITNNARIQTACENAGVTYKDPTGVIDTATDLLDDVHPNAAGMAKISAWVRAWL